MSASGTIYLTISALIYTIITTILFQRKKKINKLENKIFILNRVPAFKRSYIFTTKRSKGTKINKGIIFILKTEFSDKELLRILYVINKKPNSRIKNFITYGQFYEFGLKYLKK